MGLGRSLSNNVYWSSLSSFVFGLSFPLFLFMNWNHPNNFKFPLVWLNAQSIRTQRFLDYYTPLGQIFSYKFNFWWQALLPDAYAPNAVLQSWEPFYPEEPPNDPLTFHPGPVWREGPSYYFKALALPNFGLFNPKDIRGDVEKKVGWQNLPEWPTFDEIWAALRSQVYTDIPTAFIPWHGGGYYREDFVLYLMKRSKLLWEGNTPYETFSSTQKCFLGAGRVVNLSSEGASILPRSIVYFVLNPSQYYTQVFEVKAGCCARLIS